MQRASARFHDMPVAAHDQDSATSFAGDPDVKKFVRLAAPGGFAYRAVAGEVYVPNTGHGITRIGVTNGSTSFYGRSRIAATGSEAG